jgi:hypothetical protein
VAAVRGIRERLPDAGTVAEDQAFLEECEVLLFDSDRRQIPEPGVDAIGGLAPAHGLVDRTPGSVDPTPRRDVETARVTVEHDVAKLDQGE